MQSANFILFASFKDNDIKVNDLLIETDDLWQQIQMFTSVTDSSSSLQFKWCLSNLEENYLNALSFKRTSHTLAVFVLVLIKS